MGIYNIEQIGNIINERPNKRRVEAAKRYNKKLMMHLHGRDIKSALKRMAYFENTAIYKHRSEYAMSNVDMFERVLREEEQIFTARGGSINFNLPENQEKEMMQKITRLMYGQSLRKWISNFGINAFRADPMGLIMMEIEQLPEQGAENVEAGKPINYGIKMPKVYPVYRSIQDVWDYKNVGQQLDYVCFVLRKDELIEYGLTPSDVSAVSDIVNKDDQHKYFRFMDDEKDIVVERAGGKSVVISVLRGQPNPVKNPWGKCQGFMVSDLVMFADPQGADTPINKIVELADKYLKGRSVRDLQKDYHGFAKAVEPLLKCTTCGGSGSSGVSSNQNNAGEGYTKGTPCPDCTLPGQSRGTGYKLRTQVSDVARFPLEMLRDVSSFDFKKIFGYVTPDIDSWNKQDDSLRELESLIYFTYWGCANTDSVDYNGKQPQEETATKTLMNLAPKTARLNFTADWCERAENMICDWMGLYYFPKTWKGSNIIYSRDYIFETPDTILETYYAMKKNGMTDSMLDNQYKKYIRCLYQANPMMMDVYLRKFEVEPFPHLNASDVEASEYVTELDKLKKRYFGEWEETIPDVQWITSTKEALDMLLTAYATEKQTQIEAEEPDEEEINVVEQ